MVLTYVSGNLKEEKYICVLDSNIILDGILQDKDEEKTEASKKFMEKVKARKLGAVIFNPTYNEIVRVLEKKGKDKEFANIMADFEQMQFYFTKKHVDEIFKIYKRVVPEEEMRAFYEKAALYGISERNLNYSLPADYPDNADLLLISNSIELAEHLNKGVTLLSWNWRIVPREGYMKCQNAADEIQENYPIKLKTPSGVLKELESDSVANCFSE